MIKSSNSAKSSHSRKQYEKRFYGNYLGIVIQNNDPSYRGRIKVYVPHIAASIYENWDNIVKDKKFKFIGDNIESDLTGITDKLKHILPWAECAAPLMGSTGSGRYNAHMKTGTISDSSHVDTTTSSTQESNYKLNADGIGEKPARIYEIDELKVSDAFSSTVNMETGLGMPNNVNKFSHQYKPESYSNSAKGSFSIPNVGSHVWVFFGEGDPMNPVYFACSHGREDWNAIYDSSSNEGGYDYPGVYENKSRGDDPTYNHNVETYRSKFVLNQKGGTLEIVNTDNKEVLRLTHYSGSFKEFNNHTSIESVTTNDQKRVQGDQFLTVVGSSNIFTGSDNDTIIRGDHYRKIGTFNADAVREWMDNVRPLADLKQLFEVQRTEYKESGGLSKQSPYQKRVGTPAPCPLCSADDRPSCWSIDNIGLPTIVRPTINIAQIDIFLLIGALNKISIGIDNFTKAPANPGNFLGSGACPVCNGSGYSPSSAKGNWEKGNKNESISAKLNDLITDLTLIEKEMGLGGSEIVNITKHKVETIGLEFNDFPSIRVDEVGKIVKNEMKVFRKGVVPSFTPSPLIEYVHVDDLPGGSYTLNVCNKYNVQVGAGGISFKSYGPVDIGGTITNVVGEQVNIASENEINISSKRVNIAAEILTLRQNNNKQVYVDGNLGVSTNVIVGGGMHVEGELTVNHITAPMEVQETEQVTLYGTPEPVRIGTAVGRASVISHSYVDIQIPVYGFGAMPNSLKMYDHSHAFKNLPLHLTNSSDDVRATGARMESTEPIPAAPIENENKGYGSMLGGEIIPS